MFCCSDRALADSRLLLPLINCMFRTKKLRILFWDTSSFQPGVTVCCGSWGITESPG